MKSTCTAFVLIFLTNISHARPRTFDAAVSILGQPNFSSETVNVPPTARSFYNPEGIAIDPTTGKVFIADSGNNRILRFSSTAAYQTNAAAEAVFGQPDFVSSESSADSFDNPTALCFDSDGRLWVADTGNARVLRFDEASSKPSFTATADGVIREPDLVTDPSKSGFDQPSGIAIDSGGALWVSDLMLHRVLRFDNAASLGADFAGEANGFLGLVSVTGVTSELFNSPAGMSTDSAGNLWVADSGNHRILRFDAASGKADGAEADGVIGQPDFFTNSSDPLSAASLSFPGSVTVAPDGTAWVSDFVNHRVLGFLNAATKANGDPAEIVLGQADFVSGTELPKSARTIASPSQIAIGREGSLFVGEYLPDGHFKRFSDPVTISAPAKVKTKRAKATVRGTATGAVRVQYRVAGQPGLKPALGTPANWSLKVKRLKKKKTTVTVQSVAFDGRVAQARVKVLKKKKKKKR